MDLWNENSPDRVLRLILRQGERFPGLAGFAKHADKEADTCPRITNLSWTESLRQLRKCTAEPFGDVKCAAFAPETSAQKLSPSAEIACRELNAFTLKKLRQILGAGKWQASEFVELLPEFLVHDITRVEFIAPR